MKRQITQPMRVRTADGRTVMTCCGPAVTRVGDVVAYRPVGPSREGTCCHR